MGVPPILVRRLAIAPVVVLVDGAIVVTSPLLGLVAALASPLAGGWRPMRVVGIAVEYAARHLVCMFACLVLWVASGFGRRMGSPRMQRAHYAVLRWFVAGVHRSMTRRVRVGVRVADSAAAEEVLAGGQRPVIVLSRHAGEGDSLLILHDLLCRHNRRPRVVMHEALQLDPLIDVLGNRLPNRFVDPRGGDIEREIATMASTLGDDGAVLIFPEGANFTPARRARAIQRLLERGHHQEAAWASEMEHVSAPRPGGALAALGAVPHADVVFVGHVGAPTGVGEIWRRMCADSTVELRMWLVGADEVPSEHDEQIDWLFGWWRTLDRWVDERKEQFPPGAA